MFELKRLSTEAVPGALQKAERYRLLNQPWEAECIYRDIVEIDPNNQEALVGLILAITDQFGESLPGSVAAAQAVLPRLQDDYERAYYAGIICERRAKVVLDSTRPGSDGMAYQLLREAKDWYERAETLRPAGNDDVLLRWNSCARLVLRYPSVMSAAVGGEGYQPYVD